MDFATILYVILIAVSSASSQESENEDVADMLNRIGDEYEQVSSRNGKFFFPKYANYGAQAGPQPYSNAIEEFDFIVVGSGSAGATLATRLSENPKWRVLLLEVGKEPSAITDIPALAASFQLTDYNWGYLMEKQDNIGLGMVDQRMAWPRGRVLGGTSVINYMIHVRGNRGDYKRWKALGNPGWGYEDVLPYFKKLEDYSVAYADAGYRNRGGPIGVQDVSYRSDSVHIFINAAQEAGLKYIDYNGRGSLGVSYVQASTRRGRRCSVENTYLRNARGRPNLVISTLSRVTNLILDGTTVVGVQYIKNRQYHTAKAKKEVILSAGTFNSPQILMLSGIGPKTHLEELGIPVVRDLPVGETLYDHLTFLGLLFKSNDTITINYSDLENPRSFISLVSNGTGPLTSLGGVEALAYIQTNVSREKDKYPDVELIFLGGGFHMDKGALYAKTFRITPKIYDALWKPLEDEQVWTILPMLLHPKSKGNLKLKSKNPYHWPKLFGNSFNDPENLDMKTFIASIREVQRIARTPTFQKFGTEQVKTPIPGCEHLVFDTDEYWSCALMHITGSLHHQVGTCKMGPANDKTAVVDSNLKVYGINRLRVADCSVIPVTLSAHTNIPAIMVGEKAADLIKDEWTEAEGRSNFDPRRNIKDA
ncbi:PREDICTED: glucose dehydrogenase [FAD, quinone]-like [Nicrophorus vespilloides]|uniref:Glucose dehydrogenase [FAD, quinone]-like n=1 Tax=Nicrophorus vespilloides TaxID=110193 RepID=A0ABM1MZD9_NICVS|nr:PREDICTED: glucose dehydrogenase [FAD, quinone]-like [Nicrophorus vespilloides]